MTVQSLAATVMLLTRLPVPRWAVGEQDVRPALGWFPVVGLGLGVVVGVAVKGAAQVLPPAVVAALAVVLLAMMTGGLHLDGVADLFDAIGGAGDRERELAIMRDSRIGAFGAMALVLVLVTKVLATSAALAPLHLAVVVSAPLVARWAVIAAVLWFPAARPDGLGATLKQGSRAPVWWATTGGTALALMVIDASLLVPAAISLLGVLGVGRWMTRRFGGMTGDGYGAAIELAEVMFLVAASGMP